MRERKIGYKINKLYNPVVLHKKTQNCILVHKTCNNLIFINVKICDLSLIYKVKVNSRIVSFTT